MMYIKHEVIKMKNAIGYIRVSTENQADDDKYGMSVQRDAILKYAEENDYEIVRWYTDQASGASDERDGWNEIIYGEKTYPAYEAVIVYKNDRVARETKLYFYYLYVLEKKGVSLLSTLESFAEGSEFTNIYRALLQFVAEQERKNITLRTKGGRKEKASVGGYAGGGHPLGYDVLNGQLVINEKEAEIIKYIYKLKGHMPMLRIAEKLTEEGYRTRSGGWFYASTIKSILNNEKTYRGYYRYGGGEWVKGIHEPILTEKEFPITE